MKTIILSIVFAMVVIATQAFVVRPVPRRPGSPTFPTFPGQGTFNPKQGWPSIYRSRRSPEVGGSVTETVEQPLDGPERRPSVSLNYNHKIYEGQYGDISVTGGVAKNPSHKPEANIGIQGSIPLGSRRPSYFPPSAWDIDEYGRERVIP